MGATGNDVVVVDVVTELCVRWCRPLGGAKACPPVVVQLAATRARATADKAASPGHRLRPDTSTTKQWHEAAGDHRHRWQDAQLRRYAPGGTSHRPTGAWPNG